MNVEEATNRSMDRLMATAKFGRQPKRDGRTMEIQAIGKSGRLASLSFREEDTLAVVVELESGAPCGICHHDPCTWGRADA